jgi:hypothetical protein
MVKTFSKVIAAAALLTFAQLGQAQQKLTILWAEWDPANYLQELVKGYEKETGVKVVGRDHTLARLPEQGVQGVHREGLGLRHGGG